MSGFQKTEIIPTAADLALFEHPQPNPPVQQHKVNPTISKQHQQEIQLDIFSDDPFGNANERSANSKGELKDNLITEHQTHPELADTFEMNGFADDPFADSNYQELPEAATQCPKPMPMQVKHNAIDDELATKLEGTILYRVSARSFLMQDWHEGYYLIENGVFSVYRNKFDIINTPGAETYKTRVSITFNLQSSVIKAKEYKGYGTVYYFLLEETLDFGPSTVGKFGSVNKIELERLYNRLKKEVIEKRRQRAVQHYIKTM